MADATGAFDWAAPDAEVHAAVNDLVRPIGTHLFGRLMYEVMAYWETAPVDPGQPSAERDFAEMWRTADKVVYSTTLEAVSTARTRIARAFDPEAVRRMKVSAERDLSVGGPALAAHAFAAGLVDEFHLFLNPIVVGGGTRALPDGVRVGLELRGERRFAGGVVHLHYAVRT